MRKRVTFADEIIGELDYKSDQDDSSENDQGVEIDLMHLFFYSVHF